MNTQIVKSYWCKCGNPVEITFVKMAKGYSGHGFCKCRKYHEITVTDTEVLKHYLRLHRIQDIELVRDWNTRWIMPGRGCQRLITAFPGTKPTWHIP